MSLRTLLEKWRFLKKKEREEELESYRIVLEEVSPVDYLNRIQKKKDKVQDIMQFSDIHNLLSKISVQDKEKEELSKLEG
jgi:hypothetical protein